MASAPSIQRRKLLKQEQLLWPSVMLSASFPPFSFNSSSTSPDPRNQPLSSGRPSRARLLASERSYNLPKPVAASKASARTFFQRSAPGLQLTHSNFKRAINGKRYNYRLHFQAAMSVPEYMLANVMASSPSQAVAMDSAGP